MVRLRANLSWLVFLPQIWVWPELPSITAVTKLRKAPEAAVCETQVLPFSSTGKCNTYIALYFSVFKIKALLIFDLGVA